MTCNLDDIFIEVDKLLSEDPHLRLCELEKRLGCSHPTIRKAIMKRHAQGYREYRNQKLLDKVMLLLSLGKQVKEIAWTLGYKWPQNFTRFSKKTFGRPASTLNELANDRNISLENSKKDSFFRNDRCIFLLPFSFVL
jgi:AraC-like DNA-binding protein